MLSFSRNWQMLVHKAERLPHLHRTSVINSHISSPYFFHFRQIATNSHLHCFTIYQCDKNISCLKSFDWRSILSLQLVNISPLCPTSVCYVWTSVSAHDWWHSTKHIFWTMISLDSSIRWRGWRKWGGKGGGGRREGWVENVDVEGGTGEGRKGWRLGWFEGGIKGMGDLLGFG